MVVNYGGKSILGTLDESSALRIFEIDENEIISEKAIYKAYLD